MPVETPTGIQDLNPSWPTAVDPISEGDDHDRLTKLAIQQSFPGMTGPWVTTNQIKANGFDANANRVINVGTPVDATDAARKGETDALDNRVGALEAQAATFQSFGSVESNGTISGGSGDFTVAKTGTGSYRMTFTEAASATNNQSMVCAVRGNPPFAGPFGVNVWAVSTTIYDAFFFYAYDPGGAPVEGDLVDLNFTFQRVAN